MKITLIGYGRMGHEIENAALDRGHSINLIIDKDNLQDLTEAYLAESDVVIEFTTPETAFRNVARCLKMKVPVVCGTTGWQDDYGRAEEICLQNDVSFIHSTNFSIGVNILFRLNAELARYLSGYPGYKPFIEEIHHIKKLDAPSGTAITLADGISDGNGHYAGWGFEGEAGQGMIPIRSVREGMVPGTHTISWDSEIDTLSLKHEAKGRKGLALGAVVAAEFISNRKGVFTMEDVLRF